MLSVGTGQYSIAYCSRFRCKRAYLVLNDALDQDQTPENQQRLERVGEGVCLVRPGDVARGYEDDGLPSFPRTGHQLMYGPVLEYETEEEHGETQDIVYQLWRGVAVAGLCPQPLEQGHREAVDKP